MEKNLILDKLIGGKIVWVGRTCNMVMLCIKLPSESEMFLHIQCYLRIFEDKKLILSSENLYAKRNDYKRKLFKKFDYTKVGDTLFDEIVDMYKPNLFAGQIQNAVFDNDDLIISINNGFMLQILVNVTDFDDKDYSENYRIFEKNESDHYIV